MHSFIEFCIYLLKKNSLNSQAAVSFKTSNLLICFGTFDFSCPILDKDNFIKQLYIVLSYLIK